MRRLCASLVVVFAAGCMPNGAHTSNYGTAILATALAVGAVAAHRAATGDCWGRCGLGLACDRESGLCVAAECKPSCGDGEFCEFLPGGAMCRPDPAAGRIVSPLRPVSPGGTPRQQASLPPNLPPGLAWTPWTQPVLPAVLPAPLPAPLPAR